jgi:hypothetical protein
LHERIGPEEAAQDEPHFGGPNAERVLDLRRRDGEVGAIDVVHRDRKKAQQDDDPAHFPHVSCLLLERHHGDAWRPAAMPDSGPHWCAAFAFGAGVLF